MPRPFPTRRTHTDNDPLNHTDPLGLCRMKDGDFVFEQNRSICEDARANATSTSGCYWGGSELTFYDWDPFNTISYLDGSGCKVNLGDGSVFGEWWYEPGGLCIRGLSDNCHVDMSANWEACLEGAGLGGLSGLLGPTALASWEAGALVTAPVNPVAWFAAMGAGCVTSVVSENASG